MPSFLFRSSPDSRYGARVGRQVQVFAGPDADHRALAGTLLLTPDEWEALKRQLAPHLENGQPEIDVEDRSE